MFSSFIDTKLATYKSGRPAAEPPHVIAYEMYERFAKLMVANKAGEIMHEVWRGNGRFTLWLNNVDKYPTSLIEVRMVESDTDIEVVRYLPVDKLVGLSEQVLREFYKLLAQEMIDEYNREVGTKES